MIATLLAAAALTLPSGFYEAKALEPAASYVAGKPAHIYCALTAPSWNDYSQATGAADGANALTPTVGGAESMIRGDVCADLRAQLAHPGKASTFGFASALLILVHESIHQRGSADEGQTECAAIHEMPRVAVRFFHVKAGKQLRAVMALAWQSHRMKPAVYQSVC